MGKFPENTINYAVDEKIKKFTEKLQEISGKKEE